MPNTGVIAVCPFYVTHSSGKQWQYTITCEDIRNMGFSMRNQLRFIDSGEQESYLDLFCCSGYKDCPYYQAIYQKYDRPVRKVTKPLQPVRPKKEKRYRYYHISRYQFLNSWRKKINQQNSDYIKIFDGKATNGIITNFVQYKQLILIFGILDIGSGAGRIFNVLLPLVQMDNYKPGDQLYVNGNSGINYCTVLMEVSGNNLSYRLMVGGDNWKNDTPYMYAIYAQ